MCQKTKRKGATHIHGLHGKGRNSMTKGSCFSAPLIDGFVANMHRSLQLLGDRAQGFDSRFDDGYLICENHSLGIERSKRGRHSTYESWYYKVELVLYKKRMVNTTLP